MKRKRSIFEKVLIAVGIEILIFAIFIAVYYLFLDISKRYARTLDVKSIFNQKCVDSKYSAGWLCNLSSDTNYFEKVALEQLCFSNDGMVHNYREYLYCLIQYSDIGKLCKNSNDCLGSCDLTVAIPNFCTKIIQESEGTTLDRYNCTEELGGECSGEMSLAKIESDCSPEYVLIQNSNPIIEDNIIFEKKWWGMCLE